MGLALFQERRLEVRKRLTGLLPGRLRTTTAGDINCRPTDISQTGMGILCQLEMSLGAIVELHIREAVIPMRVSSIQQDFGKRNLFRYGLIVEIENIDLETIFVNSGCLR